LIETICSYKLDEHVDPISAKDIEELSKYYNWLMYQALMSSTKYSLNQMKERICPNEVMKPFFVANERLESGGSVLKPSLEELQSAVNHAADQVLKSTKNVANWN